MRDSATPACTGLSHHVTYLSRRLLMRDTTSACMHCWCLGSTQSHTFEKEDWEQQEKWVIQSGLTISNKTNWRPCWFVEVWTAFPLYCIVISLVNSKFAAILLKRVVFLGVTLKPSSCTTWRHTVEMMETVETKGLVLHRVNVFLLLWKAWSASSLSSHLAVGKRLHPSFALNGDSKSPLHY